MFIRRVLRFVKNILPNRHHDPICRMGKVGDSTVFYETSSISVMNPEEGALVVGDHTHIRGKIIIYHHGIVRIGSYCYVGENSNIWCAKRITIGDRVLISHSVDIVDNISHPKDAVERHAQAKAIFTTGYPDINLDAEAITIENDVWINQYVVLRRGITIGEGAIVGAGSVVTHDVPKWTFVAGNPARVIKELKHNSK